MRPTMNEVISGLTYDPSDIEKREIYDTAIVYYDSGHEDGFKKGKEAGLDEALEEMDEPEVNEEEIGVNYAVEAFRDINSFEEFKDKYLEIERRACNFMH